MMKAQKGLLRAAVLGVGVVALVSAGFASSVGGIQDDGYYDRWVVTNVACNGTSGNGEIVVSYSRTYNHPAGGEFVGTWKRTSPGPTVSVANPFGGPLMGGSGSGNAIIGTNTAAEVVFPGTYVISKQILIGGQPTYQQDLTITCSGPGSGTAASSENLFVLPLPSLTVTPNPALAGQQVTVSGTECMPLAQNEALNGGQPVSSAQVSVTIGFPTPLVLSPTSIDPSTGAWSLQFTVPEGTPFGTYDVSASCNPQTTMSYFRTPALQANGQFAYPTTTLTIGTTAIASTPRVTG